MNANEISVFSCLHSIFFKSFDDSLKKVEGSFLKHSSDNKDGWIEEEYYASKKKGNKRNL